MCRRQKYKVSSREILFSDYIFLCTIMKKAKALSYKLAQSSTDSVISSNHFSPVISSIVVCLFIATEDCFMILIQYFSQSATTIVAFTLHVPGLY